MTRKVIIDCDPGIDSAVALSLALFAPELEVLAVTAVEGNVSAEQSTLNVQAVIEHIDAPRLPRVGTARPRTAGPDIDGRALHGEDGLGNSGLPTSQLQHQHPSDKVICDLVRATPDEVTIICLGPLTNIANAFQRDLEITRLVDRLIIAGGTHCEPGNVSAVAEFNMYCDPESARAVFRSPVTKSLVPLDVTRAIPFTMDLLDQLPAESTRVGWFLRKITPFLFRGYHQQMGLEHVYLDAVVAIMLAVQPELFETASWPVDIETRGELTYGMTVFDRRFKVAARPNAEVAVSARSDDVINRVIGGLRRAAG